MTSPAKRFYEVVRQHAPNKGELVDFFIYHLTVEQEAVTATVKMIESCYEECDLAVPAGLPVQLSKGLKSKPVRYLKKDKGYRLENKSKEAIAEKLGEARHAVQVSATLRQLEGKIPAGPKRDFLKETIDCFTAGANRATVVMCWNLALHHLYDYVLKHELAAFNVALGKNTDARVKIKIVLKLDDFTEMSEAKFLLFLREAKIVTTSMYNKLESWLDDRNAAAHPSGYTVTAKVAEAYVDDLVENVLLKFTV
jgi:hypothetical protein